MNRKTIIQVVVCVVVVGALLQREYHLTGLIVTLVGIGFYLIANTKTCVKIIRRVKTSTSIERTKLITYIGTLYTFIAAAATHRPDYFLFLLILGVDYLVCDKKKS